MNELIKKLEEVVDKKVENHEIKQECGKLIKMLKTGFETKNKGMEKVASVLATNDAKKILGFYEFFGNVINALKISGNFDNFAQVMRINFGIEVTYATGSPTLRYMKKGKKFDKFSDLYTMYFLGDLPRSANDAVENILKSLDSLVKQYNNENDDVKEQIKAIIESENEHSATTVKVMDKLLTSSRIKAIDLEEIADAEESRLSEQLQGVELIRKEN
jgi:hypothetical protein